MLYLHMSWWCVGTNSAVLVCLVCVCVCVCVQIRIPFCGFIWFLRKGMGCVLLSGVELVQGCECVIHIWIVFADFVNVFFQTI
jgi:hypothetical protein